MEVTRPPHLFSGISQIRKMSPNPGSGTLYRDPLPRVSWGFTLPLCLHASQTHTSVLCPEVPGKAGATNARPCLCIWLPPLGSLGPCAVFTGIVPESREAKISTQHQSLTALLRQRAWLGIIVRQGIEPLRKFRLKGGSRLGI